MPRSLCVAFLVLLMWGEVVCAQWGTLRGRVVLEGDIPELPPVAQGGLSRDVPENVVVPDDSLVIDPETKGIAHVLVWLAKKPERIHDDLLEPIQDGVTVTIKDFRFDPHISVVYAGQTVEFDNQDQVNHNARLHPIKNNPFNVIVAPNRAGIPMQLKLAERLPIQMADDIHPWMRGYLLVVDHPYAAITDQNGEFEIPLLPPGEHEFKVWHERPGYLVRDAVQPKKGLIVQITEGEPTVVPDIKVPVRTLTEPRK